jgi:hypothetical protein
MTTSDESAIEAAVEHRRRHASGAAYAAGCACSDCLAARCAEIPKAVQSDSQERWRWLGRLIARVARRLT